MIQIRARLASMNFQHTYSKSASSGIQFLSLRKSSGTHGSVARRYITQANAEGTSPPSSLKRSYLYGEPNDNQMLFKRPLNELMENDCSTPVPASSSRMLEKSLSTPSDTIIYDLEDSVPPSVEHKINARNRLEDFLSVSWLKLLELQLG